MLYMPDGGLTEDVLHIAGLLHVSIGNGTMRPFIFVGIENTARRRDLTGPTTVESDRRIAPHIGGSAAFRTFLRAELMPRIRRQDRNTAETAIIGESLARLFVRETFLNEPALFDISVAIDPSPWWNGQALAKSVRERLRSECLADKTLFIASSGDSELGDLMRGLT